MKWKKVLFFVPLITLVGCKGNNDITTKCPLGAPSLLFFDQGNNSNFQTIANTATILAEFQKTDYDAIVIDSTSGLNAIEKYDKSPYRFMKLLTNGNLYLVSYTKSDFNITDKSTVCAFGSENSVPYLSLKTIYKNFLNENILRLDGLNQVVARLNNNPKEFDYYVLAEPSLYKVKQKINLNIQKFDLGDGIAIPQAALFINKNSYYNKKDMFEKYLTNLNTRIDICINNPSEFKKTLDKYGDDSKVSDKFGFTSNVAYEVQKDKNNGFAIYPSNLKFTANDMNKFTTKIGLPNYKAEDFINVD